MTLRVVKVGTSLLRERPEASTAEAISKLSASLAECMAGGDRLVLVSSGAVGLGCQRLGMERRPVSLTGLQAAAAIGQGHLMSLYEEALAQHSIPVAQVLLTRLIWQTDAAIAVPRQAPSASRMGCSADHQ